VRLLVVVFCGKLYDARVTEPVRVDLPDWIRTLGSADVLAPDGLVTRAIYLDIPYHRGTDWADRPVDGTDIDKNHI
jgi:hypothetical protein